VYALNYDAMSYAIDQGMARGMGMHFAVFEPGWLRNVMAYWRAGRLSPGSFVKFYFGGDYGVLARGRGVTFGLPPTLAGLAAYREILVIEGCDLPWFSAVVGGDLIDTPVARATVEQGGHLRVGLEDHAGDRTPSNLELVREAVALCHEAGRPVATPIQTIDILGQVGTCGQRRLVLGGRCAQRNAARLHAHRRRRARHRGARHVDGAHVGQVPRARAPGAPRRWPGHLVHRRRGRVARRPDRTGRVGRSRAGHAEDLRGSPAGRLRRDGAAGVARRGRHLAQLLIRTSVASAASASCACRIAS
jgi:hypothetical protein